MRHNEEGVTDAEEAANEGGAGQQQQTEEGGSRKNRLGRVIQPLPRYRE